MTDDEFDERIKDIYLPDGKPVGFYVIQVLAGIGLAICVGIGLLHLWGLI